MEFLPNYSNINAFVELDADLIKLEADARLARTQIAIVTRQIQNLAHMVDLNLSIGELVAADLKSKMVQWNELIETYKNIEVKRIATFVERMTMQLNETQS